MIIGTMNAVRDSELSGLTAAVEHGGVRNTNISVSQFSSNGFAFTRS